MESYKYFGKKVLKLAPGEHEKPEPVFVIDCEHPSEEAKKALADVENEF